MFDFKFPPAEPMQFLHAPGELGKAVLPCNIALLVNEFQFCAERLNISFFCGCMRVRVFVVPVGRLQCWRFVEYCFILH